jgi:hypothetical protein
MGKIERPISWPNAHSRHIGETNVLWTVSVLLLRRRYTRAVSLHLLLIVADIGRVISRRIRSHLASSTVPEDPYASIHAGGL